MQFLDVRCGLLVTLALAFCHADIRADEPGKLPTNGAWDRFRGPNGTGTSDDKDVPLKFGDNDKVIWKVAVPGTGNSSPIVWGKHLFLQSASEDGKRRSLICLDTADGKIRWQRSIPAEPAKIRADSSLASSTPTTDGKAVYVSFWDGKEVVVAAYDFEGKALEQEPGCLQQPARRRGFTDSVSGQAHPRQRHGQGRFHHQGAECPAFDAGGARQANRQACVGNRPRG